MFKQFIDLYPPISTMVNAEDINTILTHLHNTCIKQVPGDVVELGCNIGTTSLYIQRYLTKYAKHKDFHVYDSFEGLPVRVKQDGTASHWNVGDCKCTREEFVSTFTKHMCITPIIHSGWFKDGWYPNTICFAFFDGDLYTSIIDSFEQVWPRLFINGTIIIHDVGEGVCDKVGARQACIDFLVPRGQRLDIVGGVGIVTKTSS